jgi:hypothetical protein
VPVLDAQDFDPVVSPLLTEPDAAAAAPPRLRTNLMTGDLVEINRPAVNGRAWMSTVAPIERVLARGTRAELLSDPTQSEDQIWVKLRLVDEADREACYVASRFLDLVEARSTMPLTVAPRPLRLGAGAPYQIDDLIHTTVAVYLRATPGGQGVILRELSSNTLGSVTSAIASVGETEWVRISLPDITGWVAVKHTKPFARREKWIDVDLSSQTLVAWNDQVEDARLTISSGKPGFRTPTGVFEISGKFPARRTVATVNGEHWDIPGVPWIMVFRSGGYYVHGVYWHNDFGSPVSHGCVTLSVPDAEWLYDWTPSGTPVWIHHQVEVNNGSEY